MELAAVLRELEGRRDTLTRAIDGLRFVIEADLVPVPRRSEKRPKLAQAKTAQPARSARHILGAVKLPSDTSLRGRVLTLLREAGKPLSAAEIATRLKVTRGQLHIALAGIRRNKAAICTGKTSAARWSLPPKTAAPKPGTIKAEGVALVSIWNGRDPLIGDRAEKGR